MPCVCAATSAAAVLRRSTAAARPATRAAQKAAARRTATQPSAAATRCSSSSSTSTAGGATRCSRCCRHRQQDCYWLTSFKAVPLAAWVLLAVLCSKHSTAQHSVSAVAASGRQLRAGRGRFRQQQQQKSAGVHSAGGWGSAWACCSWSPSAPAGPNESLWGVGCSQCRTRVMHRRW